MRRLLALVLLLIALPCAASSEYHPEMYPLRPGLIAPLKLAGEVQVTNGQPSTSSDLVYKYGPIKWLATMQDVTQLMTDQTKVELGKHAAPAAGAGKTIELKVNTLMSKYGFFSWSSKMQFEARLGDGTVITKDTKHASGNPLQDLNGCIAEGVMNLLNDPQVRAYLEAAAPAPAPVAAPAPAAEPAPAG